MYHYHSVVYSPLYWECAWPQIPKPQGSHLQNFSSVTLATLLPDIHLCNNIWLTRSLLMKPSSHEAMWRKDCHPRTGNQEPGYFHPGLKSVKFTFCVLGSRYILWHSDWAIPQIERQQTHTLFWEKIICLYPILLPLTNHENSGRLHLWKTEFPAVTLSYASCCIGVECWSIRNGRGKKKLFWVRESTVHFVKFGGGVSFLFTCHSLDHNALRQNLTGLTPHLRASCCEVCSHTKTLSGEEEVGDGGRKAQTASHAPWQVAASKEFW